MTYDKGESTRNLLEQIEEDWEAPSAPAPLVSAPSLTELDTGWGDDEDDELDEPELPDERLDPVAYAAAKAEREARIAAKRQRRREKAEAKRAKQRDRALAAKKKQKGKKVREDKAPKSAPRAKPLRAKSHVALAKEGRDGADHQGSARHATNATGIQEAEVQSSMATGASSRGRTNLIMLAVAVAVLIAGAAFAATMAR